MTDPIADMLTRLRNAVSARHPRVDVPVSRLKVEIARILQDEGYIQSYKLVVVDENTGKVVDERAPGRRGLRQMLRIGLKYGPRGENVISGIERISRPGRRVYFGRREVPPVLAGLGTSILTTSRGVMTGREAVKAGVGGEVLCNVW
jgi:small subunit ribosomal protein S8